jgi:hypothetical protein
VEEGILVSPRMMADHMPDYLTAVLRRIAHARACSRDSATPSDGDPSHGAGAAAHQGSALEREARSNKWAEGGNAGVSPTAGQEKAEQHD